MKKREKVRNAANLKSILDVICDNKQKTETLKVLLNLSDEEVNIMLQQTSFVDDMKEEGRSEGREQGRQEGIKELIKRMFSNGMSIKQISKAISMPEDIVKSYL